MDVLSILIIGSTVSLWVLCTYGKRYAPERLMWILVFYVGVVLTGCWFLARVARFLLRHLELSSAASRARDRVLKFLGSRVDRSVMAAIRLVLGSDRAVVCGAVVHAVFCRSAVQTSVMLATSGLVAFCLWVLWVSSSWLLNGAILAITLVALICTATLGMLIHSNLTAVRRVTPRGSYRRHLETRPEWSARTLEGAYSFQTGLPEPLSHYRDAWPEILGWKVEDQAAMADLLMRSRADERRWATAWLEGFQARSGPLPVANLAWLALHGPADLRGECFERLAEMADQKKHN